MEVREDFIKLRCTRTEKERFKALAAAEGCDVSTLVRRRVFAGASEAPAPSPSLFDERASSVDPDAKVTVRAGTRSAFSGTTTGVGWPE